MPDTTQLYLYLGFEQLGWHPPQLTMFMKNAENQQAVSSVATL